MGSSKQPIIRLAHDFANTGPKYRSRFAELRRGEPIPFGGVWSRFGLFRDQVADKKETEMKSFAQLDSEGPTLANLQLKAWRAALRQFDWIKTMWDTYAVEGEEDVIDDDWYDDRDFVEDAVIAITLAGTSISQLLGQNVSPDGTRTPSPVDALLRLIPSGVPAGLRNVPADIADRFRAFNAVYEDVRHFGVVKYGTINKITEHRLCEWMTTAAAVWRLVLQTQGQVVSPEFQRVFSLSDD